MNEEFAVTLSAVSLLNITRNGKPLQIVPHTWLTPDANQVTAGEAMATGSLMLLSDPGAGKTLAAMEGLRRFARQQGFMPHVLVNCPGIAVYTWLRWFGALTEELSSSINVEVVNKGNAVIDNGHYAPDVTVIPYSLLSRDNAALKQSVYDWEIDILILDEGDNLTGWESKRTQAVFGDEPSFCGGFASAAGKTWFLTGTAIPRYNDGLYPVLKSLFPDILTKAYVFEADNFLDRFTTRRLYQMGRMRRPVLKVSGSKDTAGLRALLQADRGDGFPVSMRVKAPMNVPVVFEERGLEVPLSKELAQLEAQLADMPPAADDVKQVDPRLNEALRLMGEEMAGAAADDVIASLKERRDDDKRGVVLLYWHTNVGLTLLDKLEQSGFKARLMNGSTTPDNDAETELLFNTGKIDAVVGQIKAMGVAINLQANCNDVRFVEDSFSDTANEQAYKRVYRRGQEIPVTVTFYRSWNSSLAYVRSNVAEKKRISAKKVLDGE